MNIPKNGSGTSPFKIFSMLRVKPITQLMKINDKKRMQHAIVFINVINIRSYIIM
jgi:hypothetical protein